MNKVGEDSRGIYIEIDSPKYGLHKCYVDQEDLDKVNKYKVCLKRNRWNTSNGENEKFYALISWWDPKDKKSKVKRLHRFLLDYNGDLDIDHLNGNSLDNRRSNLKITTKSQNSLNRKSLGVRKVGNKYNARITLNGKEVSLGAYSTKKEALSVREKVKYEFLSNNGGKTDFIKRVIKKSNIKPIIATSPKGELYLFDSQKQAYEMITGKNKGSEVIKRRIDGKIKSPLNGWTDFKRG